MLKAGTSKKESVAQEWANLPNSPLFAQRTPVYYSMMSSVQAFLRYLNLIFS
jgi:hypothetical protein